MVLLSLLRKGKEGSVRVGKGEVVCVCVYLHELTLNSSCLASYSLALSLLRKGKEGSVREGKGGVYACVPVFVLVTPG